MIQPGNAAWLRMVEGCLQLLPIQLHKHTDHSIEETTYLSSYELVVVLLMLQPLKAWAIPHLPLVESPTFTRFTGENLEGCSVCVKSVRTFASSSICSVLYALIDKRSDRWTYGSKSELNWTKLDKRCGVSFSVSHHIEIPASPFVFPSLIPSTQPPRFVRLAIKFGYPLRL